MIAGAQCSLQELDRRSELRVMALDAAARVWANGKPERDRIAALKVMRPWILKNKSVGS